MDTHWTEVNDISTGRNGQGGSGSNTSSSFKWWYTGSQTAATEEFTADAAVATVTTS